MSLVKFYVPLNGNQFEGTLFSCEEEVTVVEVLLGTAVVEVPVTGGDYVFAQPTISEKRRMVQNVEFNTKELFEMNPATIGDSVSFRSYVTRYKNFKWVAEMDEERMVAIINGKVQVQDVNVTGLGINSKELELEF